MRGCGVGQKVLFRNSWNRIFFQSGLKPKQYEWHNLACCIDWIFLRFIFWAIVLDFLPLEIYKHLVLPLSSITFTANSQADNHFYKYIYWFQILLSMKSVFYLKCTLKCFIFKFDLNAKYRPYFFYRKTSS